VRFNYNSTRPPPSAATPISTLRPSLSHFSFQRPASSLRILIANLELKLRVSPIRISELKTPNRKFSAISSSLFLTVDRKPQAMDFLIENARLSFGLSPSRISVLEISNRERMAVSQPVPSRAVLSLPATAFLIVTARLEFLVTATKQTLRRTSNRYKMHFFQPEITRRNRFRPWPTAPLSFTDHESLAASPATQPPLPLATRRCLSHASH
jgi:hypothetical protein